MFAALGIKVRNQCTYHGLALNVAMDLAPFDNINPCGYEGLRTIDLNALGIRNTLAEAGGRNPTQAHCPPASARRG